MDQIGIYVTFEDHILTSDPDFFYIEVTEYHKFFFRSKETETDWPTNMYAFKQNLFS